MYYSARWEIRQMIFRTSSLCLYTNSSTSSTATEKKRMFRSSRFKSPLEKITKKTPNKNTKTARRHVRCVAVCGRVRALRTRVQSSHEDTSSAHTRKKEKKISHPCTEWWQSAENSSLLKVRVELIALGPPQPNNALRKSSSSSLLYKWH